MSNQNHWIQNAIGAPGALHHALKVPMGKKISTSKLNAAIKKGGINAKRANLAKILKSFHR